MSCSQPQLSFAKMASQSKVVHGKNNSPSGFLLGHRHVPVRQVRSLPHSDLPLDSSSDNGDDDDDYHDNDTNTHALHQHFHRKRGGCKFPFSFDGDKGDGGSGDDDDDDDDNEDDDDYNDDDDDDDNDDLSKATLSSLASSGDSSSSACSTVHGNDPNRASCNSNPFQPSSNRNAFGRSNDTESCCCHALTTLCNNAFLLLTLPHLYASVIIWNVMLRQKLTVTRFAMIHQKLETIVLVAVPTKVQVLMPAIPVSQCPTHSNQVPGHLSRLVMFHCQMVVQ
jgi:hypothetical protein